MKVYIIPEIIKMIQIKPKVIYQFGPILNLGLKLLFLSKLKVIKFPILQNNILNILNNLNSG